MVLNQGVTKLQSLKQKLQSLKQKLQSLKQKHRNQKQKLQNLKQKHRNQKQKLQNQIGHHPWQILTQETSMQTLGHNRLHNPLTAHGQTIYYYGTPYSTITDRAPRMYTIQTATHWVRIMTIGQTQVDQLVQFNKTTRKTMKI